MKGIELCITAVNLNMLSVEYFHPKTSPNLPIKDAVRMSVSIPGASHTSPYVTAENGSESRYVNLYMSRHLECHYPYNMKLVVVWQQYYLANNILQVTDYLQISFVMTTRTLSQIVLNYNMLTFQPEG